jgi:hypothetical protein
MFVFEKRVNSPPYIGLPSLSHQCPVVAVVVVVFVVVGDDEVVVVVVLVVEGVVVGVVVVLDVVQDAKTNDVTIRQVSTIQIAPLFIHTSFLLENFWKTEYRLIFRIFLDVQILF